MHFNIILLFHTFLCNSQNYHTQGTVDDPMRLLHEAEGNNTSGHPQRRGCHSFDCCTEKYEIVVLLPNSELTKGNNKRAYGSFTTEDHCGWAL